MNGISNNIYDDIVNIGDYPIDIVKQALKILLENACLGQNIAPIEIARKKIREMDVQWLRNNIQEISNECINFDDEWEYRRFIEFIVVTVPDLL